jgi:hypothetical protein
MNSAPLSGRIRGREPNRLDWLMLLGSVAVISWVVLGP